VRVIRVDVTPFRIPLRTTLHTASRVMATREGLLVRVVTDTGAEGLGEASPLAPVPEGPVERWAASARGVLNERCGLPAAAPAPAEPLSPALGSALDAAVDVARRDARGRVAGRSAAAALGGAPRSRILVNALVHASDPSDAADEAARARDLGFATVKLKVGAEPHLDSRRLEAVRESLGSRLKLRIDANGAWNIGEAVSLLRAWERFDLELVEQPVPAHDLKGLAAVRAAVGVRVAADEAVLGPAAARAVVAARAADILVIKPMIVGGVGPSSVIARLAHEAGLGVIVTTTIDTGVGTAAALHVAAASGEEGLAHGLATAAMLESDLLVHTLPVEHGEMRLPAGAGLGIKLDEGALEKYRV